MADVPSRFVRRLTLKEKQAIERLCRKRTRGATLRARIIQLSSRGVSIPEIVLRLGTTRQTVYFWLNRFEDYGLDGLEDRPRSGRPAVLTEAVCRRIVRLATSQPQDLGLHFTTWSLPKLKAYLGATEDLPALCIESVRTALRKGGLTLKRAQKWMLSRDPRFSEKKTGGAPSGSPASPGAGLLVR